MKKKIIIGLLLISAMSFGHSGSYGDESRMGSGYNSERMMEIMLNENDLSEEQRAEIFTIMQRRRNSTYKNNLKIREKELALEKKLAADNVDWRAVEKLNKEISDFRAKERLEEMKFIKETQGKY